jgi:tetratricopeptide (TPR) repeat protein
MSQCADGMPLERLHLGLAEQGKLHALAGDQKLALAHYREAMRLAVQSGASEVFFRHYLDCILESLEQMEAFAEVLESCDRAVRHYAENPPANPVARLDLATIHQRRGAVLLKAGRPAEARPALEAALALVRESQQALPLARTLLRWVAGGLHVDARRVLAEQQRCGYFTVRPGNVMPDRAIPLPARKENDHALPR